MTQKTGPFLPIRDNFHWVQQLLDKSLPFKVLAGFAEQNSRVFNYVFLVVSVFFQKINSTALNHLGRDSKQGGFCNSDFYLRSHLCGFLISQNWLFLFQNPLALRDFVLFLINCTLMVAQHFNRSLESINSSPPILIRVIP